MPIALPPPVDLTDRVRAFLSEPRVATLATAAADGAPHQTVIWYSLLPDDRILVNARLPRRWPADLRRDGRCSLAIADSADQYRWVGLAGVVERVVDDLETARGDIVAIATRYDADDEDKDAFRRQTRVSFVIRIVGLHDHLQD